MKAAINISIYKRCMWCSSLYHFPNIWRSFALCDLENNYINIGVFCLSIRNEYSDYQTFEGLTQCGGVQSFSKQEHRGNEIGQFGLFVFIV